MPDLTKLRKVNGRLYCWDRAGREIVELKISSVDLSCCGKDVIAAFVEDGGTGPEINQGIKE
jgi:hypothetical protein